MADAPADPPAKPRRTLRRWLLILFAGLLVVGAVLAFVPPFALLRSHEPLPAPAVAPPSVNKDQPVRLGIEYHFDRNAMVDTRIVGGEVVALVSAGNLVVFDAETFQARREKIFRRRVTCLGPVETAGVLVGLANGTVVRVAGTDFATSEVAAVPGRPAWIGKRRDGGLVVVYLAAVDGKRLVRDVTASRTYELASQGTLFLDSKDRLWSGSPDSVQILDLGDGRRHELAGKAGWPGLRGFVELSDGQVWVFGGAEKSGDMTSYVARVNVTGKPVVLMAGKRRPAGAPVLAVTHVLDDRDRGRLIVVSQDGVFVTNPELATWQPLDAMSSGRRDDDTLLPVGQAHLVGARLLLASGRGGFLEVTADFTRRHQLGGQYSVQRPTAIVRLVDGVAFYGDGGPQFYKGQAWHALPDPVVPPAELMGQARPGEKERGWAAMTTIPIDEGASYVIAKAGPPRHYVGHLHGLRDVFLTGRWDGKVLTVLGNEELPIEPDDTFATPDRQLWNVDDQGLWAFSGGHWRMVMRASAVADKPSGKLDSAQARASLHARSALGEPLHFAETLRTPFYGLPASASSWSLVRLDSNEAGGVPLIDEVAVKLDRTRLLIRDLTIWANIGDELLLATDHGLCAFSPKWGTCTMLRPDGLREDVNLFMRDGTKRLWLGGRGLWILRDRKQADAVHTAIPMLADTRVVVLAEAPDGRLVVGSEDRGAIFLTIPTGWFQKGESVPAAAPWESTSRHEPLYVDPSIVISECAPKPAAVQDVQVDQLLAGLLEVAKKQGGRTRVELEEVFDGRPDLVLRGAELEPLLEAVQPLVDKIDGKGRWRLLKRFGARGAEAVELRACPS